MTKEKLEKGQTLLNLIARYETDLSNLKRSNGIIITNLDDDIEDLGKNAIHISFEKYNKHNPKQEYLEIMKIANDLSSKMIAFLESQIERLQKDFDDLN